MLMATKEPLPVGHPLINVYVCSDNSALKMLQGTCQISISNVHPPLDAAINGSEPFPANHLKMQATFAPYMPLNHRWGLATIRSVCDSHFTLTFYVRLGISTC